MIGETKQVHIHIPESFKDKLATRAVREGTSLNKLCLYYLAIGYCQDENPEYSKKIKDDSLDEILIKLAPPKKISRVSRRSPN